MKLWIYYEDDVRSHQKTMFKNFHFWWSKKRDRFKHMLCNFDKFSMFLFCLKAVGVPFWLKKIVQNLKQTVRNTKKKKIMKIIWNKNHHHKNLNDPKFSNLLKVLHTVIKFCGTLWNFNSRVKTYLFLIMSKN